MESHQLALFFFVFFYHIGLRGDAQRQRVDAAGGEDTQVRGESAARRQGHLLLKDAAGRQHRRQAAVRSLELVEHLRGKGFHISARAQLPPTELKNNLPARQKGRLTSVHLMARPSDSNLVSCSTRTLGTPSRGRPSTPLALLRSSREKNNKHKERINTQAAAVTETNATFR